MVLRYSFITRFHCNCKHQVPEFVLSEVLDAGPLDTEGSILERSVQWVGEGDGEVQGLTNLDHISRLEKIEIHSQRRVILHLFLLNPTTMKSITCGLCK